MTRTMRALVPMVLLAIAAAPASAQSRREMQMMADIRILQEQNQQLLASLTALNQALQALEKRLDEQEALTRKGFADQALKIDQFSNELRIVREGVSDAAVRIGQLSQELEAVRLSIPAYPPPAPATPGDVPVDPTAPAAPAPSAPGTETPPGTSTMPPAPVPAGPGMSPQRLFETARADYYLGHWDLCVSGFEHYLRTFPRSELAGEAQYLIGECHYMAGEHQEAVAAYTQVITNYPDTEWAGNAYYKRGLAFDRLGQTDRARESFEAAIKNFPNSAAARLAKQQLDRLPKR